MEEMQIMDRMQTKEKLYRAALELFVQNGLRNTTVRDVANKADANSGLMHYYFKSKHQLALEILEALFHEIKRTTKTMINPEEKPQIFHGVMMRLHLYFLATECNNKFYIDCLKLDIFEELALDNCLETIRSIDRHYGNNHDDSYLLLMQSITINALRTMILKKESGLIDYNPEKIGSLEYRLFLSFFSVPNQEIDACIAECNRFASLLFAENPHLSDIRNLAWQTPQI